MNQENTPNGVTYSYHRAPQSLFVTGKLWPKMYELQLSNSDLCGTLVQKVACTEAPPSPCFLPLEFEVETKKK